MVTDALPPIVIVEVAFFSDEVASPLAKAAFASQRSVLLKKRSSVSLEEHQLLFHQKVASHRSSGN